MARLAQRENGWDFASIDYPIRGHSSDWREHRATAYLASRRAANLCGRVQQGHVPGREFGLDPAATARRTQQEQDGARQAQAQKDWLEADARWASCDGSHGYLPDAQRRAICGPKPTRPSP